MSGGSTPKKWVDAVTSRSLSALSIPADLITQALGTGWPVQSLAKACCTGVLQEERNAQELLDDEDKPDYTPQAFDSLRQVPMYSLFIKERFERCLDLYLCPRSKKKRINVDPQSLIPKLPKPQDLQPFPTTLLLRYTGHTARVSGHCSPCCTLYWHCICLSAQHHFLAWYSVGSTSDEA